MNSKLNCIFLKMKGKCLNPNNRDYKNYGGKGIDICDEWKDLSRVGKHGNSTQGWINFKKWALENGYEEGLSLCLINTNENFCPQNCKWEKIYNRIFTYKGKTQTLVEWSKELGIEITTILARLDLLHWSVEKTLETKLNPKHHMITHNVKTQCLKDWCREIGLDYHKVYNRIYNLNWSVDEALEIVEKKKSIQTKMKQF